MLTIIVFLVILGVLVFVHELGHFLVAKKNGIRADEFGFGFPPRVLGVYKNNEEKFVFVWGNKQVEAPGTVYSLNSIPLGGFVRIKGENGDAKNDLDSFAGKSALARISVLAAGIVMNFILAWVLISIVFMAGAPQSLDESTEKQAEGQKGRIQIAQVIPDTPAEVMGFQAGDEILGCAEKVDVKNCGTFLSIDQVQKYIQENRGKNVSLQVKRGSEMLVLSGEPRLDYPKDQGPLGVALVKTVIVRYSWYDAIAKGLQTTYDIIVTIFVTFGNIIAGWFVGKKAAVDVAGPIGIAYLTKQVTQLGWVYIFQFTALLSINLGIINGLPFPALDGGRILFVIIEKIKGSPVSQKVEQALHSIGFALLILLMLVVTFKDITKFDILGKIKGLF